MKKLLFASYSLDLGGIETALVTLLNYLVQEYKITLVLEKKQGIFLDELDSRVKIIEYKPCQSKNIIFRKIANLLKRFNFILKHRNRYDFAGAYATYSIPASFCARTASKNNALWVHSNYFELYNKDKEKTINFFSSVKYNKFKYIICISKNTKDSLDSILSNYQGKIINTNNVVDYNKIIKKSKEHIQITKDNVTTFLNISRHDETSKKITKLIEASRLLKENNYKFKIIMVGSGKDTQMYKKMVERYNLEDEIFFEGEQKNPYPYYNICDCFILTSNYEGYPVVFTEAKIFNKPIITTNVSDAKEDIDGKYGIVTSKNVEDIYMAMKNFIDNGYEIKEKFNAEKFNEKILDELKKIF